MKTRANENHPSGAWNNMSTSDPVDVIFVPYVVDVQSQVDVLADTNRHHRVGYPVAVDQSCVDVVTEPLTDKSRTAPKEEAVKFVGRPKVERISRGIDKLLALFVDPNLVYKCESVGSNDLAVEKCVARKYLPVLR